MRAAATDATAASAALSGLYAITPDGVDAGTLLAHVDAAIAGGARVIQYRSKDTPQGERHAQAASLAALCRGRAIYIVNDDADLAVAVGADGVHVGADDGSVAQARARVGGAAIVGVSCYNDARLAHDAVAAGADYVAFGSFHASRSKPQARVANIDVLAQARGIGVPLVAIGGIDAHNAAALALAGADAIAVITALFRHDRCADVTAAARALVAAFAQGVAARAR